MKKILAIFVMVLFAAYPAVSQASTGHGAPVEVSGVIVLQHIISSDLYEDKGDDSTDAYKIYINFDKEVADGINTHITVNADKFGSDAALEEAVISFSDVAGADTTIMAGKMEVPWGQDYSQFISGTVTHHLELDKHWGIAGQFGIEGFGSVTAGFVQADPTEERNTKLTETYAVKVKADKIVENLSVEASMAKIGKDKDSDVGGGDDLALEFAPGFEIDIHAGDLIGVESNDETRMSIGAKYAMGDATVAAEYSKIDDLAGIEETELKVTLISADYKIGNILLKANYEDIKAEAGGDDFAEAKLTMFGANYEFADGVYATIESVTASDIKVLGVEADDASAILLGLYAHF